ncbi:MAG TPA: hypothetical protein VIH74_09005 [Candidatus Acidoferrum sp.]
MLYRAVCATGAASAALLIALRVLDVITPNDFALGLLLQSVEYFAFGLGILALLLFLLLAVCPDVAKPVKLRALAAALLPYLVLAILWLIATATHARR